MVSYSLWGRRGATVIKRKWAQFLQTTRVFGVVGASRAARLATRKLMPTEYAGGHGTRCLRSPPSSVIHPLVLLTVPPFAPFAVEFRRHGSDAA